MKLLWIWKGAGYADKHAREGVTRERHATAHKRLRPRKIRHARHKKRHAADFAMDLDGFSSDLKGQKRVHAARRVYAPDRAAA